MPTSSEVAAELRKFADSLDKNPEVQIQRANISFYHFQAADKDNFLAIAKLLPRPAKKSILNDDVQVEYESTAVRIYARIPQQNTYTLVEAARPAVYKCDPILSDLEEGEL